MEKLPTEVYDRVDGATLQRSHDYPRPPGCTS